MANSAYGTPDLIKIAGGRVNCESDVDTECCTVMGDSAFVVSAGGHNQDGMNPEDLADVCYECSGCAALGAFPLARPLEYPEWAAGEDEPVANEEGGISESVVMAVVAAAAVVCVAAVAATLVMRRRTQTLMARMASVQQATEVRGVAMMTGVAAIPSVVVPMHHGGSKVALL